MTDYGKWDAYVASLALSSSEEEAEEDHVETEDAVAASSSLYGWGKPLDERGQIDRSGEMTFGNAKGNGLSTNKAPQRVSLNFLTHVVPGLSLKPNRFSPSGTMTTTNTTMLTRAAAACAIVLP